MAYGFDKNALELEKELFSGTVSIEKACSVFFKIGIHSMQSWIATRHGVIRIKRITKRLKHVGNLFRKTLQLKGVCYF